MRGFKRVSGLMLMSMGVGMFIVLLFPVWGYFIAAIAVVVGFWVFFF